MMIDLPLIICGICGVFYGVVWVLNRDLIWEAPMPEHFYGTSFDWRTSQSPKGLWYGPLIVAFIWPQHHEKISLSPMSDFLWERIFVTVVAVVIGLVLGTRLRARVRGAL